MPDQPPNVQQPGRVDGAAAHDDLASRAHFAWLLPAAAEGIADPGRTFPVEQDGRGLGSGPQLQVRPLSHRTKEGAGGALPPAVHDSALIIADTLLSAAVVVRVSWHAFRGSPDNE